MTLISNLSSDTIVLTRTGWLLLLEALLRVLWARQRINSISINSTMTSSSEVPRTQQRRPSLLQS